MLDWVPSAPYTAEQLLEVLRILRDPENGCPWDKVQTHASIRKNFLEETCEVLEAIDADDPAMLREELGDVLMQVVFHAVIAAQKVNARQKSLQVSPQALLHATTTKRGLRMSERDVLFPVLCGFGPKRHLHFFSGKQHDKSSQNCHLH